jgi:hypothetical protein
MTRTVVSRIQFNRDSTSRHPFSTCPSTVFTKHTRRHFSEGDDIFVSQFPSVELVDFSYMTRANEIPFNLQLEILRASQTNTE